MDEPQSSVKYWPQMTGSQAIAVSLLDKDPIPVIVWRPPDVGPMLGTASTSLAQTTCSPVAVLMLGLRLRRLPNIKTAKGVGRLECAGVMFAERGVSVCTRVDTVYHVLADEMHYKKINCLDWAN